MQEVSRQYFITVLLRAGPPAAARCNKYTRRGCKRGLPKKRGFGGERNGGKSELFRLRDFTRNSRAPNMIIIFATTRVPIYITYCLFN